MNAPEVMEIARHRTALVRGGLSRPLKMVVADGLLCDGASVMDYGCGRGSDVRLLRDRGFDCVGWDPTHASDGPRRSSDIVNLGYVVNVIESPAERGEALTRAWALARRVLIVSARLRAETPEVTAPFADGHVTRLGTFQKFYEQQELRIWIDQTLDTASVPAAPGIFYVFRDPGERAAFVASRFRRVSAAPRLRSGEQLFKEHKALLEPLAEFISNRGRLPAPEELPDYAAIRSALGSVPRAHRALQSVSDKGVWDRVRESRAQDLLVFVALSRFDGRPKFSELPLPLQRDVKAFFGTYRVACAAGDEHLFSLGRPERLEEACRTSPIGKVMPRALYVHVDAVTELPILLRLCEGCARGYIGAVQGANIVKLANEEPKVSYLSYPDFDRDPHPALAASVSVNLQSFRVRQRQYAAYRNPPILHRKEAFVSPDHPGRAKFERLTRLEEANGLFDEPAAIGTRSGWERTLRAKGLALRGHRLVRRSAEG
jgi:DNA phosphorothioation-associated putative methyltransferase